MIGIGQGWQAAVVLADKAVVFVSGRVGGPWAGAYPRSCTAVACR